MKLVKFDEQLRRIFCLIQAAFLDFIALFKQTDSARKRKSMKKRKNKADKPPGTIFNQCIKIMLAFLLFTGMSFLDTDATSAVSSSHLKQKYNIQEDDTAKSDSDSTYDPSNLEDEEDEDTDFEEDKPSLDNSEHNEGKTSKVARNELAAVSKATSVTSESQIVNAEVTFLRGGTLNEQKNLAIYTPSVPNLAHRFTYRLDYTVNGTFPYGGIQITLPLHLMKQRDGSWADQFECPYLPEGLSQENEEFVYQENEAQNTVTIFSGKTIEEGLQGYIEFAYRLTSPSTSYKNLQPSSAVIGNFEILHGIGNLNQIKKLNAIPFALHTKAKIKSTKKMADPAYFTTWQSEWGKAPAKDDSYSYLVWTVHTTLENYTEPYAIRLEDSFDDLGGKVIGYKFSGQNSFSKTNTSSNDQTFEERYDEILVCFSKVEAEKKAGKDGQYNIQNQVQTSILPIDEENVSTFANSKASWTYKLPRYEEPSGSFWIQKYGIYGNSQKVQDSNDISSYKLQELTENKEPISNLKFYAYLDGYPYPWTIEGPVSGTDADIDKYGKVPVNYSLSDESLILENTPLDVSDYDLDSVSWRFSMRDAKFDETTKQFQSIPAAYTNTDTIQIEVQDSTGNWNTAASYDPKSQSYSYQNSAYVQNINGYQLTFPAGVKGCRLSASNAHYETTFRMYPSYTLYPTDHVLIDILGKSMTEDKSRKAELENTVEGRCFQTKSDGTVQDIFLKKSSAIDYLHKAQRTSRLVKRNTGSFNNKVSRQVEVFWQMDFEEFYLRNSQKEQIYQSAGAFFDLLPAGSILDESSIKVYANDQLLEPGSYKLSLIENYRSSGRTMVKVQILIGSSAGYRLEFHTFHSYDAITDYGKSLLNPAAYETGNADLGNGTMDDGGALADKELMSNLDEDAKNARRFIYTQTKYKIDEPTASRSGLLKQVKSESSDQYGSQTNVPAGGNYSYKIRLANNPNTETKDIVFFDSLENVYDKNSNQIVKPSTWYGTLTGIDVMQLEKQSVKPQIYVSTIEKLNINKYQNLDDSSIWKPLGNDTDLSSVKAIAVDCSKDKTGKDFILGKEKSLTFTLYLKAPLSDLSKSTDPCTFNSIYVKSSEAGGNDKSELYEQGYTKVHLRVCADLNFKKVNSQNLSEPVAQAVYELSGTSQYGKNYVLTAATGPDGSLVFSQVEKGTYLLREISSPKAWQINPQTFQVVIDEKGSVFIDGNKQIEPFLFMDAPRIFGDVALLKIDENAKKGIGNAEFKLSGTSAYGNDVLLYKTSTKDGKLSFTNIELGEYTLTETKAPAGYVKSSLSYQLTINEQGQALLFQNGQEVQANENDAYLLENEPLKDVSFVKSSSYGKGVFLEGAKFHLWGISNAGNSVDMEAVSETAENFGLVTFKNLESGTYQIQEVEAPKGKNQEYILDSTIRMLVLNQDGFFTLSGLSAISIQDKLLYNWTNQPVSAQVRIIKEWKDDLSNETRNQISNIPDITLTTIPPYLSAEGYTITFNAKEGTFASGKKSLSLVYAPSGKLLPGQTYEIPTLPGIPFGGWEMANGQKLNFDANGNCLSPLSGDVAADAIWLDPTLLSGRDFNTLLPNTICHVRFVQGSIPSNLEIKKKNQVSLIGSGYLLDVSNQQNESELAWLEGDTVFVSNADASGKAVLNTNCSQMFENKTMLVDVSFEGADCSKVKDLSLMFHGCLSLPAFDLSLLDTGSVTTMQGMFQNCQSLVSVNLKGADLSKVQDMSFLFNRCTSMTTADFSTLQTSSLKNLANLCSGMNALTSADFSGLDLSKVTNMSNFFALDKNLNKVNFTGVNSASLETISGMFSGCSSLTSLDLSNFHTPSLKNMQNLFYNCSKLDNPNLSGLNTGKVTNMIGLFAGCTNLSNVDLSSFDTSSAENMSSMFMNARKLSSLDLSDFKTQKVVNTANMFNGCRALTKLDFSNFSMHQLKNCTSMFASCVRLTTIYASSWLPMDSIGSNGNDVFTGDTRLVGENEQGVQTKFNGAKTNYQMCTPQNGYFTDPSRK